MQGCPFKSDQVLDERISAATLRGYNVGFDQNRFRLQPLVDVIVNVIPEFAGGYYEAAVPLPELRTRLKEAALSIYTTDKYRRRGEFGELILHLLLRDFCGTIPLISKIFFKDNDNMTLHGFDGVHVTDNQAEKVLWLGESKIYTDGKAGVVALADDLRKHLEHDYLRREFCLISKKLPELVPESEHWRELLNVHQKLETILDSICIPMVCTYSSGLFSDHNDNTEEYIEAFVKECKKLHELFKSKAVTGKITIILMLLPVPSKDDLVEELDTRLKHMQAI